MSESAGNWKGVPIETFKKSELIQIIVDQGNEIESMQKLHEKDLNTLAKINRPELPTGIFQLMFGR